jgi:hypothetical protein
MRYGWGVRQGERRSPNGAFHLYSSWFIEVYYLSFFVEALLLVGTDRIYLLV